MKKTVRQIPRNIPADARRLSPMEMNNLHFILPDRNSTLSEAKATSTKTTKK